jgi:hypothetical protein
MKRQFLIAAILSGVIATTAHKALAQAPVVTVTDQEVAMGKAIVLGRLLDPSSAQFQNVTITRVGRAAIFCGQVNAKNQFGGYTGYRPFIVFGGDVSFYEGRPGTKVTWQKMEAMTCDGGQRAWINGF